MKWVLFFGKDIPRILDFGDVFSGYPANLTSSMNHIGLKSAMFDRLAAPGSDTHNMLELNGFLNLLLLVLQIREGSYHLKSN
jgi:hypothetical protein